MAKHVPSSKDEKNVNVLSKNEQLPLDNQGNIDWVQYYQKMTPQIDQKEFEELKKQGKNKKSPFTPEYNDDPFLNDEDIYNKINEDGELAFIDSEKDSEEFEKFEEEIDQDYLSDDEDQEEEEDDDIIRENIIYNKSSPSDGDAFLIIIEEDDSVIDKIIFVHEITEKDIIFKDEDDNEIKLYLDEEKNIILQSDDYQYDIIEFERIQEIEPKDLEDDKLFLTKNIYDDIELDVEELKEKVYSLVERKESLITELISLFNAQKNKQMILDICEISENYIQMLKDNIGNDFDYTDKLPFLKNVTNGKYNFPKWILPIANNVKKIYKEDGDISEEFEDTSSVNFEQELKTKKEILETNTEYESLTKELYKTKPFYNKQTGIVLEHDGHYIRDCNDKNPCHGIKGEYIFEVNKTRKDFKIPLINKDETYYRTIINKEQISLSGLYIIPHTKYNLTYENNGIFPLYYTTILANDKYSYVPMNKLFNYDSMAPHIIGPRTDKSDLYPKTINSYFFDEFVKQENIKNTLNNLPSISDIIDNIPKKIMSKIYNHNDIRTLLLPYSINYSSLDVKNKNKMNETIEKNTKKYINNYKKHHKKKILKKQKKQTKILSTDDKIDLSWNFIHSVMNIPVKNNYIREFIDAFSREPFEDEDERYLYKKNSPAKLLCKHYIYSSKIDNDEDSHLTLKRIFGGIPKDGTISCNVCGEYLCPEDFSLLEGFSDGAPKNTKEVLKQEKDSLRELSDKQILIMKKIKIISSLVCIELNEFDKNTIIDFFDTVNDEELIDLRYKNTNTMKKHPVYKEINKKYKAIKPKTDKDKELNKKNKKLLEKEKDSFKKYLIDSNEFLIITYLVLFHLQVSSPPYDVKTKDTFNLWNKKEIYENKWNQINNDIHTKISMKTVNTIFSKIEHLSSHHKKNPFWNNVSVFMNESNKYKSLSKPKSQFMMVGYYILKNSKLRKKLKDYYQTQNDINISVYLKESWSSFKPLQENSIIVDINKQVNDNFKNIVYALKEKGEISYENISSIRPFDYAYQNPRRFDLKIPYSDIMKNESYKRLLEFSIHLHGIEDENTNINLTINNFIQTIQYGDLIETMLLKIGWNKKEKRLPKINYYELRKLLFEIQNIFIEKDVKEKDTIDIYNFIKINNWNGMLLNGTPKRFYSYKNPTVLPFKTYEELKEIYDNYEKEDTNEKGLNVIKELFKKYCFDNDGTINVKLSHDEFILNIVADPSFEREILCHNDIPINKENFEKIMNYKISSKKLPLQDISNLNKPFLFENRLFDFIEKNKFLEFPGEYTFSVMKDIYSLKDLLEDDHEKIKAEYRRVFNTVESIKNKFIENIQLFIEKSIDDSMLSKEQIAYYKKNRGRIDNLNIFINDFLTSNNESERQIENIFYILGRLSNNRNKTYQGTVLSSDIPKHWKISEMNENNLEQFMDEKEFLLHNEIFIESSKYQGFYKYLDDEKYSHCFRGLLDYMKEIYQGGIHDIKGDDNSYYKTLYSNIFKRFFVVYILDRMIQYIDSLYDEQSLPSQRATELFLILEEKGQLELKDSIEKCSCLFFDILMNILDENTDTNWIYNKDISDKLSRQKETEKQDLINDLEGKTSEQRISTVEMQNAGIINWYKDFSSKNLERIKEEKYSSNIEEERLNTIKELLLQKQSEIEVSEQFGVNTELLLQQMKPINEEEEQGFDLHDQDREEEGDDDGDHHGDYRED
tara:strand:- start:2889 stop:8006 length:5118 start_codon:yes stop_codon:yes gene_type:complete